MSLIGKTIVHAGRLSLYYGEQMLKDVRPDSFARLAVGSGGARVLSNHPAWVYGHLALYWSRCFDFMGLPCPEGVAAPAGFEPLFKNGVECKDDPQGVIYPAMEIVVAAFQRGGKAVLAALPEADDEALQRPNPAEGRFKELFPTCGSALVFLTGGHPMSHLGQVSAWRRFSGLGSAM